MLLVSCGDILIWRSDTVATQYSTFPFEFIGFLFKVFLKFPALLWNVLSLLFHILSVGDMIMKTTWKTYLFWILFTQAVGVLSGWLTRDATKFYQTVIRQPPLSPPALVFPIVWTILFTLMGLGAARIYLTPASNARSRALLLFFLQLTFNFFWSILFFNFQLFGFSLLWLLALWVLILLMILAFRQVDPLAAALQIPYLLWVTFAAYLNLGVWLLNR